MTVKQRPEKRDGNSCLHTGPRITWISTKKSFMAGANSTLTVWLLGTNRISGTETRHVPLQSTYIFLLYWIRFMMGIQQILNFMAIMEKLFLCMVPTCNRLTLLESVKFKFVDTQHDLFQSNILALKWYSLGKFCVPHSCTPSSVFHSALAHTSCMRYCTLFLIESLPA